ncbi:MAG: phage minor capsid protein [Treponema sp.]
MTGVNQTAAAVSLTNCDELECDLVEVTAHLGARPSHEAWQGKIYKLHGSTDKYPNFYEVCRYGEADGICGVNCRHSVYPYFEGQEKHYTQDDLDELSAQKVSYNGEAMSRYEGEQKLRHIERNIRFYKKKAAIYEAAGLDNTKARDFTKQTGIMRDSPRERIGMKDCAKQPRGLPPAIQGYAENLKQAQNIKRLDNAQSKVIAKAIQGKPMNFRQADGGSPNPNYKKGGGYANNCQTCVVAYELRRRGFNVEALSRYKGSMLDVLAYDTRLAWVDKNTGKPPAYIIPAQPTVKQTFEYLKNNLKKEHRYTIQFVWEKEFLAHIIHLWKNRDNILSLYDPQNGINTRGDSNVMIYLEKIRPSTIKLLDVQNCDINMNLVNKIVQEAVK